MGDWDLGELEKRMSPGQIGIRTGEDAPASRTVVGSIKYDCESRVFRGSSGLNFVEVISPGAFSEYMKDQQTLSLWNHCDDQILGSTKSGTLRLRDGNSELGFELDLPNSTWGDNALESIRRGDVDGVSFGFNIPQSGDRWEKTELDGEPLYKRTILKARLLEISPTPFAAYPANELSVRSLVDFKSAAERALLEREKAKISIEIDLIG